MKDKPLQILVIDRNAARAAILEDGLREAGAAAAEQRRGGFVIHHIRDLANLPPRIAAIDPDVILIDLEDPSRDTLEQMFSVARAVRRPIAMFVDRSDAATVQAAIDAGVSAYIVDGLRTERVKAILDVTIARFRAFDRLRRELLRAKSALEERKVIEQAKGILMRTKALTEEQAYALLRRTAMSQSRRIADLARSVVEAASVLDDDPPGKR
ncbi:MAG TPA: ANTAR domain-containing protein [Gammaproteobacteria bacterium]